MWISSGSLMRTLCLVTNVALVTQQLTDKYLLNERSFAGLSFSPEVKTKRNENAKKSKHNTPGKHFSGNCFFL